MPQAFHEREEVLLLQRRLVELQQRLKVESTMLEASKRIQANMDNRQNAQQIGNSVAEAEERILFLQRQIGEVEQKLARVNEDRRDLEATIRNAASGDCGNFGPVKMKQVAVANELEFWRAGTPLTAAKVEYKVRELGCRLKIQENILEGLDRMLEAWQTHGSASGKEPTEAVRKLQDSREQTKQKASILSQALKKYASLAVSENSSTSESESTPGTASLFTGKLLLKVTQLSNLNATSRAPFSLEFVVDQLSPFSRHDTSQQGASLLMPINNISVAGSGSELSFYQELNAKLNQASELQIILRCGQAQVINGIFFMKLSSLLPCGPDQAWKLSETLDFEPIGAFAIQLSYQPSSSSKSRQQQQQQAAAAANRIQRKPALKRTQHQILGHQLLSTNFFQLLKCSYCQELIMTSSGYQCSCKPNQLSCIKDID